MKIKQGYIALNQCSWGDGFEIYGVFTSKKEAEARLREVIKSRFASRKEKEEAEHEYGESYKVIWFSSEGEA